MLRESRGNMHHALLVLRSIESKAALIRELNDALAKPGYVAMSKNAPDAFDEPVLLSIALDILVRHELHQCLSNRKTDRFTHNSMILLNGKETRMNRAKTFPGDLSNIL
jgi:hypothetical protein